MRVGTEPEFEAAWSTVADVEGWLTEAQARRLWAAATPLEPPARIVEIGSYRGRSAIVLGLASTDGVELVAIDPHAGNDRGPMEIHGSAEDGQGDHEVFLANLRRAGVDGRVRHVRAFSSDAHGDVQGDIDVLYIDGAHRYRPALDDILTWGARVVPGGTMLIHDSFNSVGVTLAQLRSLVAGKDFAYVGRSGSMSEYRRVPEGLRGRPRLTSAGRQLAQLGYFAQSVAIKAALVAKLKPVARALGHKGDAPWPY